MLDSGRSQPSGSLPYGGHEPGSSQEESPKEYRVTRLQHGRAVSRVPARRDHGLSLLVPAVKQAGAPDDGEARQRCGYP
jgi:hypothetical protein